MDKKKIFIFFVISIFLAIGLYYLTYGNNVTDSRFVTYTLNCSDKQVKIYWKDDKQEIFKSIQRLKAWLSQRNQQLEFAMNGGMYKTDNSPQGLYIEDYNILSPLDTLSGKGNFYLKPNGIFYITKDNIPVVCNTTDLTETGNIKYATQSGPMLVINGHIHPAFKKGSENLNIRNGVGVLPDNHVMFVMSKQAINLYDFADYFKQMGCKNALYLDGFVSRTYLPEKDWIQTDGNFGIIIGVTTKQ